MQKEKTKVYTYTRVSTAMQVDGYSLDAQKAKMKAYADYNDYEIVGEYEDAGKSGKSIEGRAQFSQMMEDIKSGKDGVSYVLVFKLSRFGRNAADVLSSLQVMQDFGVNLVYVEDGIDSSKDAGKLMISVLSAVVEIERENIRVQTMEGRIQKAREGRWNGGFAPPYGYRLVDGKLMINEEEAAAIRVIYDQYVHTDIGANGIAKYLENHGIRKIPRQNGKNPLFDAHLIRLILKNPVYCGKIAYGRRKMEKVCGTRNEYKLVEQDNYLLADGLHEPIVSEEVWQAAQVKLLGRFFLKGKGDSVSECYSLFMGGTMGKIIKDTIHANGIDIGIYTQDFENEFLSLTDIARYKSDEPTAVIQNWMRNRDVIEFLGLWERLHNPNFNPLEFANAFTMSPKKWIEATNAIGIVSKAGRYGGTYAHKKDNY